ncbi:MAG: hypothetical protein ACM3VZ_01675 [Acidobacteriota bacterium]
MIAIRTVALPLAALACAALTACGGGGGNGSPPGGGGNSGPASVGPLALGGDNYDRVISNAAAATAQAGSSGQSANQVLVGADSRALQWGRLAQAAARLALVQPTEPALLLGAATSRACEGSGTVDVVKEGAGANGGLAVDEVVTAHFTACVDGFGNRFDGDLKIKLTQLNTQGGVEGMALKFEGFKAVVDDVSETLDGTMAIQTLTDLYMLSAPALRIVTASGGVTQTESWSEFLFTVATSTEGKQLSFGGQLTSSQLDNHSVEVSTPEALTFVGEAPSPNSGKVVIKGANHSVATLTVHSEVTAVTISVDANGDGTPETSKDVLWQDIIGTDLH